jgi:hypothetical protein
MGKFPILMRLISFMAFATAGLASAAEPSAQAQQAALAGRYDGGQMEMAVALELGSVTR